MNKLIVYFLIIIGLTSCEKEVIEPPKVISIELPNFVKNKVDSTKIGTNKKKKKKNRNFFLKKLDKRKNI
jgi:hypothetical protein